MKSKKKNDRKLWERALKNREAEVNAFIIKKECHDVTFLVGEDKISVSAFRCALASISPVFHAMFFSQMRESGRDTLISIPDIDPKALQCIVRFSNGLNPGITEENCLKVKYLTEKYQIKSLDQELDDFIIGCLNEENFCTIFCEVYDTHISSLVEKCVGKLEAFCNFGVLLASQGFLNLCVDQMKLLVSSEYFVVCEETIWKYCVKWAKHKAQNTASCENPENNQAFYLKQIKSEIRFTFMSTEFILGEVHPENTLSESEIIAVLSDINCPSSLMKSSFCCKVRSSLHPASYYVYGAGDDIVNGQYDYFGHFLGDGDQKLTVYTRFASDGEQLALHQVDFLDWYISGCDMQITNENAHNLISFGNVVYDYYYAMDTFCPEEGYFHADKGIWKSTLGQPPIPRIRAFGRCFPLPTSLQMTPTETP